MRNLILLWLFAALTPMFLLAQTEYKNVKIIPAYPKAGEKITIEYQYQNGPLKNATDIELVVAVLQDKNPDVNGLVLNKDKNKFVATYTIPQKAQALAFGFHSGERWDNNGNTGFFVALKAADGNTMPENKAAQAVLAVTHAGVLELASNPTQANQWLDEAFKAQPALRPKYLINYISNLTRIKRGDAGKPEALLLLEELENAESASEKDLMSAVRQYEFLRAMDKSAALKDKIRAKFPKGTFVQQEKRANAANQADLATREKMIADFVREFPPQTEAEQEQVDRLWSTLAMKMVETKNLEKFREIAAKLPPAAKASLYNNIAWELAEAGEDLGWARLLSKEACDWAEKEMLNPTQTKPATLTQRQWDKQRREMFSMYADTQAYTMDQTSEPGPAAALQGKAVEMMRGKEDEMNERYCKYLERAKSPLVRAKLEEFIAAGHATPDMKEQYKKVVLMANPSEKDFEKAMAELNAKAEVNIRKELTEQMLEITAPKFALVNLKGETISLESLKGKVVILDFWATWCGPCKSSFPGMQMAQEKYQSDDKVAFVFIDTWERVPADQKAQTAGDFINSKKYPFNVLLDLDDKVVGSYNVSGIPTKFILDKSGIIRFKSVGYSGSSEKLVEELSRMIDLAKNM